MHLFVAYNMHAHMYTYIKMIFMYEMFVCVCALEAQPQYAAAMLYAQQCGTRSCVLCVNRRKNPKGIMRHFPSHKTVILYFKFPIV